MVTYKSLKEISEDISYGYTDSAKESGNVKFLRITDIVEEHVDWDKVPYCTISDENTLQKNKLEFGDIVIARTGKTTGYNYTFTSEEHAVFASYLIRFRINSDMANPLYVGYVLKSSYWRKFIQLMLSGSAQKGINAKQLGKFSVPLPSLEEQENIVKRLTNINEKIDINLKTESLLEEYLQMLFHKWFVDYNFADQNGLPYSENDGELNEVGGTILPKGWELANLASIANYKNGLAMQKYRPQGEESLPVLKIRELKQGYTDNQSEKCDSNIPESVKIYDGDIIFSWSASLFIDIWTGGNAGLNQHLFKVTSEHYPEWFIYFWTKFYLNKFSQIANSKKTTMGHINRKHLEQSHVVVPPEVQFKNFDVVMKPMFQKLVQIRKENQLLRKARRLLIKKYII